MVIGFVFAIVHESFFQTRDEKLAGVGNTTNDAPVRGCVTCDATETCDDVTGGVDLLST